MGRGDLGQHGGDIAVVGGLAGALGELVEVAVGGLPVAAGCAEGIEGGSRWTLNPARSRAWAAAVAP